MRVFDDEVPIPEVHRFIEIDDETYFYYDLIECLLALGNATEEEPLKYEHEEFSGLLIEKQVARRMPDGGLMRDVAFPLFCTQVLDAEEDKK